MAHVRSLAALGVALFAATACTPGEPRISDAWLRAAPDGRPLGVAYFELSNPGQQDWLIAVDCDAFASATLHETVRDNQVMRMRARDRVEIPANATVSFRPGGLHVMLDAPLRQIAAGDRVTLTARFASGREVNAIAEVRRDPPGT